MRRKVDLNIDTTETVDRVLSSFPAECVRDRGRLCMRVSTAVARAEHNLKFGTPMEDIYDAAGEAAAAVEERCLEGITIDEDRRTECGYGKGFDRPVNLFPKWLFPEMNGDTNADI